MNAERLRQAGIDYEQGLGRFLGDKALYETVLQMFLEDKSLEIGEQAMAGQNRQTLFSCAHELKGACGNMDMHRLYHSSSVLVECLREQDTSWDDIVKAYDRMKQDYLAARQAIVQAMEG